MIDPQKQMDLVAWKPLEIPELLNILRAIQWRLSWYDGIEPKLPREQQEITAAIFYFALETAIKMIEGQERVACPQTFTHGEG